MCGRFTLRTNLKVVGEWFDGLAMPDLRPRYNIAPSQQVLAIRVADGKPEATTLKWGFLAPWAKSAKDPMQPINAKSETVGTSRMFRPALQKRRCLIPADGFFEWKADGKKKQPFYIRRRDESPFAFAGIWTEWGKDDESIQSFAILTKAADEQMAPLHARMPVMFAPPEFDAWLSGEFADQGDVEKLLAGTAPMELGISPVSTIVNSPRNDVPACVEPIMLQKSLL